MNALEKAAADWAVGETERNKRDPRLSKVLVTGGHGLIGAWTASRLASGGDDVTLFDTAPIEGSTERLSTLDVNVRGTQVLLEFASAQRHLRRVVLFSTSEVYGRDAGPSAETDPAVIDADSLRWGYAAGKLTAEFLRAVRNRLPDLAKARALLGYPPSAGLTEGIDRVAEALRDSAVDPVQLRSPRTRTPLNSVVAEDVNVVGVRHKEP